MTELNNTTRAIIGGTGFLDMQTLRVLDKQTLSTPFGDPSSAIYHVQLEQGKTWQVLLRHGDKHHIAPHCVNYRANLWALKTLNIQEVIAVNAVGGIHQEASEGRLVLPDQIIDYSYARAQTYYDLRGVEDCDAIKAYLPSALEHIEFTQPFNDPLRNQIKHIAGMLNIDLWQQGTCAVTQGPRLETAAEIRKLAQDGCDIVGMTSMPEASLAQELGLQYASIALVVNKAAGLSDEEITLERIHKVADQCMQQILKIITHI